MLTFAIIYFAISILITIETLYKLLNDPNITLFRKLNPKGFYWKLTKSILFDLLLSPLDLIRYVIKH